MSLFSISSRNQQTKTLIHTVKSGETLSSIARANGITVDELMKANNLKNSNIFAGDNLKIPSKSGESQNTREISYMQEISDEQIRVRQQREKFVKETQNPDYKVKPGDNPANIAKKFGVETNVLLALNNLDEKSAKNIKPGMILHIPPARTPQNINSLRDVADAMGVSYEFILKLKRIEDGKAYKDNEFHNYVYDDATGKKSDGKNVKGTETIGIGHVWKKGEPRYLNDKQIKELLVKDLLKMEDHLRLLMGGKENYDRLPAEIKEALLDMTFNKGTAIIKNKEGFLWCLKNGLNTGNYDAAICKMTDNRSMKTKKELSGLSKRRLMDMSFASKIYTNQNKKIPQVIINTAQEVYNRGIELLRAEYPDANDFKAMLAGFNDDTKLYWGNMLKLKEG